MGRWSVRCCWRPTASNDLLLLSEVGATEDRYLPFDFGAHLPLALPGVLAGGTCPGLRELRLRGCEGFD